ncbi:MAG: SCO family protein [Bacteroidetes bacterium]|jgi:protein SCO1/2|nr:MAG: SCO family protein [Bacteroidota bacterium]
MKPQILYAIVLAFTITSCENQKQSNSRKLLLPVIGEKKLAKTGDKTDTIYHTIGSFTLVNQYGEIITDSVTKNKIYVADFFFATCQSICPKMSHQLRRVQDTFANKEDFLILSHTVNPQHDTVEVLKIYGEKYGARKDKWHLLTGDKKQIYDLARYHYLVNADETEGEGDLFIHSELFLLIDKEKRIRGIYDGTDSLQVNQLIRDIRTLDKEYHP